MTGSLLIVAHRWLIQFAKERQWMTAQMQMHIREVNYMFADERKKVREHTRNMIAAISVTMPSGSSGSSLPLDFL